MESSSSKYFLILLAIFYHINSSSASRNVPSKITASTEFIKTSCSSTTYPTLCYKSLARHASLIQTSPKLLAHASLNVTLAMAKSTSAVMLKISKSLGMKPREAEAMQDCLEELSDSVDELRKSIGEMGLIKASNFELTMNDIQTWVRERDMEGSSSNHMLKYFLILLAIFSYLNSSSASRHGPSKIAADRRFIKTSCSSTTYPTLCYKSLARHASLIQTSPKLLAHASLNVTLAMAKSTSAVMLKMSKSPGMKPREVDAMQDCLEELSDSVDELRKSIGEMGLIKASNFELTMSDIQTWVSAALTDETTCSDGFEKNTVNGKVVRAQIVKIAHMTSNALALINSYASLRG
ncbi:hypothetical protein WN944_024758 [Citrus x changshan-huyou]|uniref:Pectinesterase inhibitor domain-containing protein n=1 Tax=Citrus x changshan-huyou TaxID=2935761 RepID=A0AAP0LUU4_9ROSI